MNDILEYLVKSGIALAVLYIFFWFTMRKGTHFRINRFILMFSIVISVMLPSLAPRILKTPVVPLVLPEFAIDFNFQIDPAKPELNALQTNEAIQIPASTFPDIWKIIWIIYLSGACIVLARLIYQAIFLHAISRLSERTNYQGFTIVSMTSDMMPFSYFNKIFIPMQRMDESSWDPIIAHERSHLSQGHYIDLFIIEMIGVLQWFNPFIWLYEKSIKEVHEYLADEAVLSTGGNPGRYQALMVNQAMGGPVFILTNQFNQSLIKKRIQMMKKVKTSRAAQLKALLIVPLIAALLLAFANSPVNSQPASGDKPIVVTGRITSSATHNALPRTAVVIKGTTTGTVTDAEGNYKIQVAGSNDVLVFSGYGYRTQEIMVGSNTTIHVLLEPDMLMLDFSKGNMFDANEKRDANTVKEGKDGEFVIIEAPPTYPGGTDALQQFLKANLKYPEDAKKKGIIGKVMVSFIIDSEGRVADAKILRGVSPELDKEALRLTNMITGWKPAISGNEPVSTVVTMPVVFKLD